MKNTQPRFQFGNTVVVDTDKIGLVIKTFESHFGYSYDVYIRAYKRIGVYEEKNIKHFVYSKELSEEEKEFYL
jgi:hypothetical protein